MSRCSTCAYRHDCHGPCIGYEPDDATREGRDAYRELCADIERDERE